MVGPGKARLREDLAGEGPETALHPIANHRSADLLRDRDPEPHRPVVVAALADEEDEAGHGRSPAAIGGEEIGAPGERL
jgi:hypothetical protein